jgi:glycerol-3-phosphate dehydrogenase
MQKFSSLERKQTVDQLKKQSFDVLVIGGGITGAGIALDASSRGLHTGLIEMQDFAAGTSSRSTKLVHGGLRYLKQLQFKMVADVGKERAIVYENGPHVTTPEKMLLPFYKGGTFGPLTTNIGLLFYDLLAGVHKNERRKMLTEADVIEKEPLLRRRNLRGAGLYVEYKTDDARLTIEVLKKAVQLGARAINYTKAIGFIYEGDNLTGVSVKDLLSGEMYEIQAKKIINATGPWVDHVRELDLSKDGKTLHLTKGVHLVFNQQDFPLKQAVYFDGPDGRMIFAIPRGEKTYVGTTDTSYKGDMIRPDVTKEDKQYILQAIHYMFPSLQLKINQIESAWAGLRPLIAAEDTNDPGEISRKDEIFYSPTGLISIAGGKLTGYRKMAENIIDVVTKQLKKEESVLYSPSNTKQLPISGGDVGGSAGFIRFKEDKGKEGMEQGLTHREAAYLVDMYGSNVPILFNTYSRLKQKAKELDLDPVLLAQLVYAMEYESACTPSDFFVRRTGTLFFHIDKVYKWKQPVIDYMAKHLGWTKEQKSQYRTELEQLLVEANPSA